jgi:hypothetical protein
MQDPSLALQRAVFAAASAALDPVKVYDDVPLDAAGKVKAAFPYAHIGEDQVVSDADQCHDAATVFATVHVWSRAVGKVEAKTLIAALCLALDAPLAVAGFGVIGHTVVDLRHMTDADGQTKHSIATFRYRLGPVA